MVRLTKKRIFLLSLIFIFSVGLIIPQELKMPVENATSADYNSKSFWYYPWGKSVTHKGVDIFAKKGTNIHSATKGVIIYTGHIKLGGNIAIVLGPKWRLHYYAHMNEVYLSSFSFVDQQDVIGSVGTSGNATGKAAHLHYAIASLIPYFWRIDDDRQGWKKMFYLNPIQYFKG